MPPTKLAPFNLSIRDIVTAKAEPRSKRYGIDEMRKSLKLKVSRDFGLDSPKELTEQKMKELSLQMLALNPDRAPGKEEDVFGYPRLASVRTNLRNRINELVDRKYPHRPASFRKEKADAVYQTKLQSYIDFYTLATFDTIVGAVTWNSKNLKEIPGQQYDNDNLLSYVLTGAGSGDLSSQKADLDKTNDNYRSSVPAEYQEQNDELKEESSKPSSSRMGMYGENSLWERLFDYNGIRSQCKECGTPWIKPDGSAVIENARLKQPYEWKNSDGEIVHQAFSLVGNADKRKDVQCGNCKSETTIPKFTTFVSSQVKGSIQRLETSLRNQHMTGLTEDVVCPECSAKTTLPSNYKDEYGELQFSHFGCSNCRAPINLEEAKIVSGKSQARLNYLEDPQGGEGDSKEMELKDKLVGTPNVEKLSAINEGLKDSTEALAVIFNKPSHKKLADRHYEMCGSLNMACPHCGQYNLIPKTEEVSNRRYRTQSYFDRTIKDFVREVSCSRCGEAFSTKEQDALQKKGKLQVIDGKAYTRSITCKQIIDFSEDLANLRKSGHTREGTRTECPACGTQHKLPYEENALGATSPFEILKAVYKQGKAKARLAVELGFTTFQAEGKEGAKDVVVSDFKKIPAQAMQRLNRVIECIWILSPDFREQIDEMRSWAAQKQIAQDHGVSEDVSEKIDYEPKMSRPMSSRDLFDSQPGVGQMAYPDPLVRKCLDDNCEGIVSLKIDDEQLPCPECGEAIPHPLQADKAEQAAEAAAAEAARLEQEENKRDDL